jgi:hypothetical protein
MGCFLVVVDRFFVSSSGLAMEIPSLDDTRRLSTSLTCLTIHPRRDWLAVKGRMYLHRRKIPALRKLRRASSMLLWHRRPPLTLENFLA